LDYRSVLRVINLIAAQQPAAKILAVDANPDLVATCRRNLAFNGLTATVVHAAVGEENQSTILHVPQGRATRGTLGEGPPEPARGFGSGRNEET